METRRMTAIKTRIQDIINGEFIKQEGMMPDYILTKWGQKISRVNIYGIITDKFLSEDGNYATITIDDGTGAIRAKTFKDSTKILEDLKIGDTVIIIGKLREYADEVYISPEAVKKITDPNYETLRNLEILRNIVEQKQKIEKIKKITNQFADIEELKAYARKNLKMDEDEIEAIAEILKIKEEYEKKDYKPIVLELIEKLDKGEGVEMKKILEESKLPENIVETTINELLSSGVLFEPRPGIIKKV
jgi:RPA family protein